MYLYKIIYEKLVYSNIFMKLPMYNLFSIFDCMYFATRSPESEYINLLIDFWHLFESSLISIQPIFDPNSTFSRQWIRIVFSLE